MNEHNVNIDEVTETAVVTIISNIFSDIAYMDHNVVKKNISLACDGGFSKSDRSIRVELANYLMNNFGIIFFGLIVNEDFRKTFTEAVAIEITLSRKPLDYVNKVRRDMQSGQTRTSVGNFTIDFSRYNDAVYRKINEKLLHSFEKVDAYSDKLNSYIDELTEDDKVNIGYVIENFMYLLKAFSKNDLFADYVKVVVKNVKDRLDSGIP